jgi:hypothetical protein
VSPIRQNFSRISLWESTCGAAAVTEEEDLDHTSPFRPSIPNLSDSALRFSDRRGRGRANKIVGIGLGRNGGIMSENSGLDTPRPRSSAFRIVQGERDNLHVPTPTDLSSRFPPISRHLSHRTHPNCLSTRRFVPESVAIGLCKVARYGGPSMVGPTSTSSVPWGTWCGLALAPSGRETNGPTNSRPCRRVSV